MKSNNQGNKTLNHETFVPENLIFDSFWNAFGDLSIGIIVVDRNATIRFFNSMAGYFMGIQPLLVLGKPVQETLSETKILETLSTGIPHYDKQRMVNGKQLKCSSIPIKIQGKIVSAVEFMLDNTEKTSITKQLKDQREKYDLLDGLIDATFEELGAVDRDGRLTYISRKSAQNLGFSRHEILGIDMSTIDGKCFLKEVANTGVPYVGKISRAHKKSIPVMVTPILNEDKVSGAVCRSVFTDMAEAKESIARIQRLDGPRKAAGHPKRVSGCRFSIDDIIGKSKTLAYAKKKALRVAEGDSTILITGESGTGKELFAQAIHMASLRRNGPFGRVNCAGIPESLLESELFGYEPGSFTGAGKEGKPGKFESAHNGTIFLDEAGDMSMGMQAKVLRVIQENEIERVGGSSIYEVDVRIICATNKDLWDMVNKGQFREDLYYRLDVVNIHVPPLRERTGDIPFLIEHFIPIINKRANSNVRVVSQEVMDHLLSYDWPGNVRELKNVLEGAMNLNIGESIDMEALPSRVRKKMAGQPLFKPVDSEERVLEFKDRRAVEKAMIEQALSIKNGNKRQAAIYLNMSRSTFYNKLKTYKIDGPVKIHQSRTAGGEG